jgi:hypothetical protein
MAKRKGRPSRLTPKVEKEFVGLIKAGNYIETACATVGIGRSTYYDWRKKADESTKPNKYTRFMDEVRKAQAWAEARDVAIINIHAENNWRAAAWKMERKYPNRWGRRRFKKKEQVSDKPVVSPVNISREPVVSPVNISREPVPREDRVLTEQARYIESKDPVDLEESQKREEIDGKNDIISNAEIEFLVKRQFYPSFAKKNPLQGDRFI